MKMVGVNRAPVQILPSSRVGDSGHNNFTKKKIKSKQKELNEHPGTGSDPPIGSDQKGVVQQGSLLGDSRSVFSRHKIRLLTY